MATIRGGLELRTQRPVLSEPLWVRMILANDSDQPVSIVNPDVGVPPPNLKWTASKEAYRIGVLTSFGFIQITLQDAAGARVESNNLMPWVTPLMGKRVLRRHESVEFDFDLNELYRLTSAGRYHLHVRYGEPGASADAALNIDVAEKQSGPRR
jgi:hypothetical protein